MSVKKTKKKDPNRYPPGWDHEKTRAVIDYYDRQTEDEAIAEAEAAYQNRTITLMHVPTELVLRVRELIAKNQQSKSKAGKSKGKSKGKRAA